MLTDIFIIGLAALVVVAIVIVVMTGRDTAKPKHGKDRGPKPDKQDKSDKD